VSVSQQQSEELIRFGLCNYLGIRFFQRSSDSEFAAAACVVREKSEFALGQSPEAVALMKTGPLRFGSKVSKIESPQKVGTHLISPLCFGSI
jgi:hypothetical protein